MLINACGLHTEDVFVHIHTTLAHFQSNAELRGSLLKIFQP